MARNPVRIEVAFISAQDALSASIISAILFVVVGVCGNWGGGYWWFLLVKDLDLIEGIGL